MNPKKVIAEYHLLSALIIVYYLTTSLLAKAFWELLPIISMTSLCLLLAELVLSIKNSLIFSRVSAIKGQTKHILLDLSPYLFTAVIVLLIEHYLLNHPLAMVARAAIAILSMGCYAALAIALELEYSGIQHNVPVPASNIPNTIPASLKLRHFLAIILALGLLNFILPLVGHFDKNYRFHSAEGEFQEVLFISILVLSISIYLFYLYHRNLLAVLTMQVNALRQVNEGNFDITIPIVSNDEAGLLAGYYNTMIARLRERDQLYKTLEKSVGGNIMNKLLTTDEETLKQGQTYHVAILFCDLRGFSMLGESASAEEIILFLNVYFADVSGVISQHNGIINKFMGDAVLAIFGLENRGNAVEDAVNAALVIVGHSGSMCMPNDVHAETGVGIDFGEVIAGTIGSDERYEYTIIGDAVNKASRLEGLSKRLEYSVILSDEAYERLSETSQQSFFDLGCHKVRGRTEAINVYGSGKKQPAKALA